MHIYYVMRIVPVAYCLGSDNALCAASADDHFDLSSPLVWVVAHSKCDDAEDYSVEVLRLYGKGIDSPSEYVDYIRRGK
jgi:hypothetical protein